MKKTGLTLALAAVIGLGATACTADSSDTRDATEQAASFSQDNPFAAPSELPLQFPPFDQIRDEHFAPAFDAGMAEQLAEIEAIANNPEIGRAHV